jgi:hypothetical protein
MTVHVTRHAAERYLERVNPRLTMAEAIEALSSPTIRRAAEFGAAYVRLGTGQRVALDGFVVVTVLPRDQRVRCLGVRERRHPALNNSEHEA